MTIFLSKGCRRKTMAPSVTGRREIICLRFIGFTSNAVRVNASVSLKTYYLFIWYTRRVTKVKKIFKLGRRLYVDNDKTNTT